MPASPQEALIRLQEGNRRFIADALDKTITPRDDWFSELSAEQHPFAVIVGCSDSRVPVELVFDQGPGDLFVVRVAGNVVGPTAIGSIEFGVGRLESKLIVILGHSSCGAIKATLEALRTPGLTLSDNLQTIVNHIRPAMEPLLFGDLADDDEALVSKAVRANIENAVRELRRDSEIVDRMVVAGDVAIVGAEYDLQTGRVEFLDDLG